MKSFRFYLSCLVILAGIAIVIYFQKEAPLEPEEFHTTHRRTSYAVSVSNRSPEVFKNTAVTLLAPLQQHGYQRVISLSSHPNSVSAQRLEGQHLLQFELLIPPYGSDRLMLETTIELLDHPRPVPLQNRLHYTQSEYSNDELVRLSATFSAATVRETAQNASHWVSSRMEKLPFLQENLGLQYAWEKRRGDCTEFAQLLTTLLRVRGVPARVISGFLQNTDGRLRFENYHNWVEFYDRDRWRIADPFKDVFDKDYERYIAFQIIDAPSTGSDKRDYSHFFVIDERLEGRFE